uniref:V-type proton ATPase subunit a n=1 Tax=Eptatretus burgeri TaxID=7764 RepID=A0A8C4R2I5_EPTBU
MADLYRGEEVCLAQLFLQTDVAYACLSELGELALVEFRDLNSDVNAFQRKYVCEIRRCEDVERIIAYIENEIEKANIDIPDLEGNPKAPQHREFQDIKLDVEQLERELREVESNRVKLNKNRQELLEYSYMLRLSQGCVEKSGAMQRDDSLLSVYEEFSSMDKELLILEPEADSSHTMAAKLSFVSGVVSAQYLPSMERMLWRGCHGHMVLHHVPIPELMQNANTGEFVHSCVFLVSYWGEQIGMKVRKICECYHCHIYPYPESKQQQRDLVLEMHTRIEDIKLVLQRTEDYLQQKLHEAVASVGMWRVRVRKMKAIYHTMNMCRDTTASGCLVTEVWCPVRDLSRLQHVLEHCSARGGLSIPPSFLNCIPTQEPHPTIMRTNKFTSAFQNIVDSYGVASYREVNPTLYTLITFPFLFAVMFGDFGHGLLMTLFALWLVLTEQRQAKLAIHNEIWRMFFNGRYMILLMGLFSIYTGLIYNDCFSKSLVIFPSSWNVSAMFTHGPWRKETLKGSQVLSLDPNVTGVFSGPYPFGIDPVWNLAVNRLSFLNSYKMKMSIILGVFHMTFGVVLSIFNLVHFGRRADIFLVFVPQLVFLLSLFGYLVILILHKWVAWGAMDSARAPSILVHFINMVLFPTTDGTILLFHGQRGLQQFLLALVLGSGPILLFGKPLYLYRQQRRRMWRPYRQAACVRRRIDNDEEDLPLMGDGGNNVIIMPEVESDVVDRVDEKVRVDLGEEFMYTLIHTIEYCLGCVSNTASYLRLWALSLAHTQLSEVLWEMVMSSALQLPRVLSAELWARRALGAILLFPSFALFVTLTFSVLIIMEGLSAFLHALRLHWVEFQSKFYTGTGYKFTPFSFKSILEGAGFAGVPLPGHMSSPSVTGR